jgi:uncharacterized protein (TIGR03435 family)
VQNKTGLDGKYDFTLAWSPETERPGGPQPGGEAGGAPVDSGLSLFTAINEQLGLKLEPQKSAVPVYVVVTAEKPSEN